MDIEVVGQADAVVANLQCIGITPAALQTDPDGALRVVEEGLFEGVGDQCIDDRDAGDGHVDVHGDIVDLDPVLDIRLRECRCRFVRRHWVVRC